MKTLFVDKHYLVVKKWFNMVFALHQLDKKKKKKNNLKKNVQLCNFHCNFNCQKKKKQKKKTWH